jgi:O-antigen/teichoic acid export membrane protein
MTPPQRAKADGFSLNVLRMFAVQGLTWPMNIATGVLTARFLGPHDRGLYSLLLMIPHTLEVLLKLGIAPANIYMICREKVKSSSIVSNSVLFAFGLGAIALLVLPFRDILGEKMLANVSGWYLSVAVALVPFYILTTYLTSILYALNHFQAATRRTLVSAGFRLAGTFLVLVVLHKGLFEAFLVSVVVGVLTAVWLLATVSARTSVSLRPNIEVASTTLRFGLKSHAQTLLTALHLRLDHFLIALFLGPSEVAFYAIASHIAELIGSIHRPVSIVLYPRFASTSDARIHDTTITVCRHVLFLEAIAAAAILLGSKLVIGVLYGPDYLPAVQPLFILIPGVLMLSIFNLLTRNFMSRDKQQITIAAGTAGLAVNILLNIILVPMLGISGAALASTISYSLATVLLLVAFRRHSGIPLMEVVRVRRTDFEFYARLVTRLLVRPVAA